MTNSMNNKKHWQVAKNIVDKFDSKFYRIELCPWCHENAFCLGAFDKSSAPAPHDFMVCGLCLGLCEWTDDMHLVKSYAEHPDVLEAIAEYKKLLGKN